ncbi:MAG: helix-turn-helix transcriptional regulator, partial [Erysipelotrichaceae bacterium]|nr:helix-turn-helix transcriptional regulator [Erysipelotrichaceae bacterium]
RIRILYCLFEKERSVTEISELLQMNQSAISHQLRFLKNSKLVKNRRNGKTIYYSLDDDHVYNIILQGIEHVSE